MSFLPAIGSFIATPGGQALLSGLGGLLLGS